MKTTIAFLSGLFLLIYSCGSKKGVFDFSPINYDILAQGQYASVTEKRLAVVTRASQIENYLDKNFLSNNGFNTIHYNEHMLLAVFIGEQNTAGYSVTIDALQENKEEIHFYYTILKPEGMTAAVIAQPFLITQLPRSNKKVLFFENGKLVYTHKN